MPISGINSIIGNNNKVQCNKVSFRGDIDKTKELEATDIDLERNPDSDELKMEKKEPRLSKAQKEKIIYKAQCNSAGWAILGHVISSLYYGLRSDNTIAEKYNLDTEKDQKFISEIRRKQVIATIPSIFGINGLNLGIPAWLYFKLFTKPSKD